MKKFGSIFTINVHPQQFERLAVEKQHILESRMEKTRAGTETLAQLLRRPEVASAIIGASRPEQIADNVRAVGVTLPAEALARIDQVLDGVVVR